MSIVQKSELDGHVFDVLHCCNIHSTIRSQLARMNCRQNIDMRTRTPEILMTRCNYKVQALVEYMEHLQRIQLCGFPQVSLPYNCSLVCMRIKYHLHVNLLRQDNKMGSELAGVAGYNILQS